MKSVNSYSRPLLTPFSLGSVTGAKGLFQSVILNEKAVEQAR
jgi:hypothetical protein